jgi:hypothetical protein
MYQKPKILGGTPPLFFTMSTSFKTNVMYRNILYRPVFKNASMDVKTAISSQGMGVDLGVGVGVSAATEADNLTITCG